MLPLRYFPQNQEFQSVSDCCSLQRRCYQLPQAIDSGMQGIFGEYDASGNIIQEFEMELADEYIYRVYKYDFADFYFEKQ